MRSAKYMPYEFTRNIRKPLLGTLGNHYINHTMIPAPKINTIMVREITEICEISDSF